MTQSLNALKKNYEDKLKEFEALLTESNEKIINLQKNMVDDPLIKEIYENPQIL